MSVVDSFLISTYKYVPRINEKEGRNLKECSKDYMGGLQCRKMKKKNDAIIISKK